MDVLLGWWRNGLPGSVKFVLLTLLANGLPAFLILMIVPQLTDILFVWTIKPAINARLVGVMYSNALLLVAIAAFQTSWERVRINMVVITLFSIFATLLTFFYLEPFLAHPWFHLAYWLTMYFVLFFSAPVIFFLQERKQGGKLPVCIPLSPFARLLGSVSLIISLIVGLGLLFNIELVNSIWPWVMPPLVGGLIGVLFLTHAAAYAWALFDGDWLRVRPIFWQALPTGILFALLPVLHARDLREGFLFGLVLYLGLGLGFAWLNLVLIWSYRSVEKRAAGDGR